MKLIRIIKLIIWIIFITLVITYVNYKDFKHQIITEDKNIVVWDNSNLRSVLINDLWYNSNFVKVYLKFNLDSDFKLQKWAYTLQKWDNIAQILKTFEEWIKQEQMIVKLTPWWNIYDYDECFSNPENKIVNLKNWDQDGCLYYFDDNKNKVLIKKWIIKSWDFVKEALNINKYKNDFKFLNKALTLEWYLYADTYYESKNNFSLEKFTKRLLSTFETKVYNELLKNKTDVEINEVITLASILEREEKDRDEKPIVAWILKKRYDEKWMIGADITACYAYKLTDYDCKMNLSKYVYEKNDYNTRTKVWLPKTPINNPTYNSIYSTINFKATSYYYYLHNSKTWEIYYWKTLEEHNYNKRFMN